MVVETDAIRLEDHVVILYYVQVKPIFPEDQVMKVLMMIFDYVYIDYILLENHVMEVVVMFHYVEQ